MSKEDRQSARRLERAVARGMQQGRSRNQSFQDAFDDSVDDFFDQSWVLWVIGLVLAAWAADHFVGWTLLPTLWGAVKALFAWAVSMVPSG